MTTVILIVICLSLLSASGEHGTLVSNPDLKPVTSPRLGLYVNNGNKKIDRLQCYDFDNLMVAFQADESLLAYDKVIVALKIMQYNNGKKDEKIYSTQIYHRTYQKSAIQEWVRESCGKAWIFKDAKDMKEASPFKRLFNHQYDYNLTRSRLELNDAYTGLGDFTMTIVVTGSAYHADQGKSIETKLEEIEVPMACTYQGQSGFDYAEALPTARGCYPASSLAEKQNPLK